MAELGVDIRPFGIAVPEENLVDLRDRLMRTRWPDEVNDANWSYGVSNAWLAQTLDYWREAFDWRSQETAINRLPQFRARTGEHDIHFFHLRSVERGAVPLLLTHGWPGSFVEMLELIPLLADPAGHGGEATDAFDVIVPSLPGFGFSSRPRHPGTNPRSIASIWAELMEALGYRRYGVQGGDWGASVSTWMALDHPDRVAAIHLNWVPGSLQPWMGEGARPLSKDEAAFLARMRENVATISSHTVIHASRPQTLAVALNDSPAGLAAWLLDKFRMISDCDGDLASVFSLDALLTNLSVYWFTGTIGSSMRLYREAQASPLVLERGQRVGPPLGFALFPGEVALPPREWLERGYRVARWSEMQRGGHFAAMEQPAALAEDIRAFFRPFRASWR